jgi:hypothetical protein
MIGKCNFHFGHAYILQFHIWHFYKLQVINTICGESDKITFRLDQEPALSGRFTMRRKPKASIYYDALISLYPLRNKHARLCVCEISWTNSKKMGARSTFSNMKGFVCLQRRQLVRILFLWGSIHFRLRFKHDFLFFMFRTRLENETKTKCWMHWPWFSYVMSPWKCPKVRRFSMKSSYL